MLGGEIDPLSFTASSLTNALSDLRDDIVTFHSPSYVVGQSQAFRQ